MPSKTPKKLTTKRAFIDDGLTALGRILEAKAITVVPPPVRQEPKDFLRADPERTAANLLPAIKALQHETAGAFDLAAIADDGPGYGSRLRVLKALRGGDRVVVKDAEPARLRRELHAAVGVKTAGAFALRCTNLLKEAAKGAAALKKRVAASKADGAHAKREFLRGTAPIFDGKPILDAPRKMTKEQEAEDSAQFRAALAARVARKEQELPIAQPRPDTLDDVSLDDVCMLVDPANGIMLLCLEKPNSQGAICVYNNGSRVAAGVVAMETLRALRPVSCTDLVHDINQLLSPLESGVIVTSTAEQYLTAVLEHCKESIEMIDEKVVSTPAKKFAAKKSATKKSATKKSATKKTAKAEGAPTERKSSLFRLLNDTKATWSAFTAQKGTIVAAFVKLGAVGKTATGVTRAKLIEALPDVGDKNISFYLSKWQPLGVVEKLPAAE